MCQITIRDAYKPFFKKKYLAHKNFKRLNILIEYLRVQKKIRAKFEPNYNFDENLIRSYNELLEKQGNVQILGVVFKKEILEQLEQFYEALQKEFIDIEKDMNIFNIKDIFIKNERELKKDRNIPEDDDLMILSGYCSYEASGSKYFITEDEHFLGYDDLIQSNFGITIVKEWECHKLVSS